MAHSPVTTSAVPVPAEAPTSAAHVTKAPATLGATTVGTATLSTAPLEATPITSGINPDMATVAGARYSAPLRTAIRRLPVARENNSGYSRDRQFGTWIDAHRDCQNTRAEVLLSETRRTATYTSTKRRCTVKSDRWVTSLDNRVHSSATTVQIDHLVPVAEAWGSGARHWTKAKRVRFYNDLGDARTLSAQSCAVNQSKGARGPEAWIPRVNKCRYINEWVAVKIRWNLKVDATEKAALTRYAAKCPNVTLRVTKA
ncbi:HNH endonuclease [Kytococcus sedentarius]|uniref:GmrSD restriction endonucleases C-terminal domain-containing protein n=1 Tax=Kytococcus sedentarius (strain ATCC 14392 / DSM 20547 / JCM 11482 / CCUG 33030 / NBRC 15357 / NCTC 11040 / CCM 314 / 541) TaxID=478801 RepID=C7NJK9_KYTSD|nr:HNH endonuclease family protein [Kytococcus sedentarius]ACV05339.1 protein of unknown function (DUF1994) [Kytococcus sedentarius DSM 20547]QQB63789.1 HNH endonuclease [Kytococcus sedentarius]STX13248.1 Domain of uncharacterised function (DUF1994) [Kytococcus sedentarius]